MYAVWLCVIRQILKFISLYYLCIFLLLYCVVKEEIDNRSFVSALYLDSCNVYDFLHFQSLVHVNPANQLKICFGCHPDQVHGVI